MRLINLISFDLAPGPTSADRDQRIQILDVCCLLDRAGRCYENAEDVSLHRRK